MNERLIIVISYEQLMFCVNDNLSIELCIVFVFCILYYTYVYLPCFPQNIFFEFPNIIFPSLEMGWGLICGSMQCSIFTFSL